MSLSIITPVVEAGRNEEAEQGTFGAALPTALLPELKNYADHEATRQFVANEIVPILTFCREDRQQLHEDWKKIRNMNRLIHDEGKRYYGRSDAFLPIWARTRATLVSSLSRGLFPSDDYFDVVDRIGNDVERSRPLKTYMQWEMESNAKLRTHMKRFLGQLVDYGTSPMKIWYNKEIRSVADVKRMISVFDRSEPEYGFKKKRICEGMQVSARNLFYWYMYPTTADSLDEASVVFEDIDVNKAFVEEKKRQGKWKMVDEAINQIEIAEHEVEKLELLMTRKLSRRPGYDTDGKLGGVITVTEVWCLMPLPSSAFGIDEDYQQGELVPAKVVLIGDQPVEVTRNPFFHQRPPYEVARVNTEPGLFYGDGFGTVVRPMQMLANDFANQTNDNGNYSLNPVAIVNPGLMVGPPRPLAPGVTWYATDVNAAVKFDRPPWEQVQVGMQMTNMYVGMAQDFGGAPPMMQGAGAGKAAKTATGAQILQKNAMTPLQDIVEDIENEVMGPLLYQGWKNAQQYRDQKVMAAVAGDTVEVGQEQLAGDFAFRWLASSQAVNNQVRAQQAIALIQAIAPVVPQLMQQGYIVDFSALIKKVYVDGFGFRGFDQFITKAQAVPGAMPGMPIRPDQMNGVQAEQGDRMRSALEQVAGMGGVEAQPGEAEDFMAVRAEADQLAAMLGSNGGGEA